MPGHPGGPDSSGLDFAVQTGFLNISNDKIGTVEFGPWKGSEVQFFWSMCTTPGLSPLDFIWSTPWC